jgi:hypothetical protein
MNTSLRMQELCRSETGRRPNGDADPHYLAWRERKRPFRTEEIAGSWLLKLGERCGGYIAHFAPDGTLIECDVFAPQKTWPGSWKILDGGVLEVYVPSGNEQTGPILCTLSAIASREGALHAGAETTTEGTGIIELFKVIDLGKSVSLPATGEGQKKS